MIIHNPILTGSLSLNGTTLSTGNIVTTGSNTFVGNQTLTGSLNITGSVTATGNITAQTLVVQTITSSVVYSSGSNVFGNVIGNTHQFTGSVLISGSTHSIYGNVGIGTTSPNYTTSTRAVIALDGSVSSLYALQNLGVSAGYLYGDASNVTLWAEGSRAMTVGVASAGSVTLTTNNTARLTVGSSGNVGINNTNPSYALDVVGYNATGSLRVKNTGVHAQYTVDGTTGLFFRDGTNAAWKSWLIATSYNDGSDLSFMPSTNTSGTPTWGSTAVVFQGNGRVGMGLTSPDQKLVINQGATGTGQGVPGTSGTTQNGILRLRPAVGLYGETLDMGMNVTPSYGWIQATNQGALNANYSLFLNPNGGNVAINNLTATAPLTIAGNGWADFNATVKKDFNRTINSGTNDYIQYVILLHPIYNGTLIDYNICSGRFYQTRGTTYQGNIVSIYDINTQSAYNTYYGNLESINGGSGRLVTCTYGGVLYMAFEPNYYVSSVAITFEGYIRSTGTYELQFVAYRNSNTSTVLNSEINSSIATYNSSVPRISNGGIAFNNPSATVNSTLNDYETGTFTPAFANGTFSYSVQTGTYTKVGNMVTIGVEIIWTANSGGSSTIGIILPFTASTNATTRYVGSVGYSKNITYTGQMSMLLNGNSTLINLYQMPSNSTPSQIQAGSLGASGEFQFSITYIANF